LVLGSVVTRDETAALRVLCERNMKYNNEVYVCYADYGSVDWIKLMTILQNIGVDWRDRKLNWNICNKQIAYVRIGVDLSTAYTIGRR